LARPCDSPKLYDLFLVAVSGFASKNFGDDFLTVKGPGLERFARDEKKPMPLLENAIPKFRG